ncbi:flagellar hook-associated family protein [Methylocystis sp. JAN1]|uniref:flagellar hook-associated family protein n=1 Tax=Methylocystis sp. JAN1 TaxID=3397211 RepID=UPI003FA2E04C
MFYTTSTFMMTASLRSVIANLQSDLARSQKEMTTGVHADLGATLGVRASRSFSLAGAKETIDALRDANKLVNARLDASQSALDSLLSDARNMRATLLAAQNDGGEKEAIIGQARQGLATLIAKLNSGDGDGFLFGGIRTDQPPVADYFASPPSANKLALDAAFSSAFGFGQTDPALSAVTPAQLESFLSGGFQDLFSDAGWRTTWSDASDQPLRSQIGPSRIIDSSVTANEPALQKLAAAYAMMGDLGADNMSRQTYAVLLTTAMKTVDEAMVLLTKTQARVGVMQSDVRNASEAMAVQSSAILLQLQDLEGVDQTAAAARVNGLMTQIETAYTLTSRISQLSLAKYL